jgi:ferredoxin-NADP reductase/cytochrome b involved in lipid metabolism
MSASFALFVPLSIFVARFCRHAPRISFLHAMLGSVTAELILASATSALFAVSMTPAMSLHRTIGLAAAALVIASIAFAVAFKSLRTYTTVSPVWWLRLRSLHEVAGWVILGLGWVNAGLGFNLLWPQYMTAFYGVLAAITSYFVATEAFVRARSGNCTCRRFSPVDRPRRLSLIPLVSSEPPLQSPTTSAESNPLSIGRFGSDMLTEEGFSKRDASNNHAPSTSTTSMRRPDQHRSTITEWFSPTPVAENLPTWSHRGIAARNRVHKTLCFSIAEGYVIDLASYVAHHPGGSALLFEHAGKDLTSFFVRDSINDVLHLHSRQALELLRKMRVAVLGQDPASDDFAGFEAPVDALTEASETASSTEPTGRTPVLSVVVDADTSIHPPLNPMLRAQQDAVAADLRCIDVIPEDVAGDVKTFFFEAPPGFHYSPGQHGVFMVPAGEGGAPDSSRDSRSEVKRSWTLSVHPSKSNGRVVISVKRGAHASRYLHESMSPGGSIRFFGIAGTFTPERMRSQRSVLLLAGGIGITPMRAMLPSFIGAGVPVSLVYSVRSLDRAPFVAELSMLSGCSVTVTATAEPQTSVWAGRRGRIDEALIKSCAPSGASIIECYVFICGPRTFENACRAALVSLGHSSSRVFSESFDVQQ